MRMATSVKLPESEAKAMAATQNPMLAPRARVTKQLTQAPELMTSDPEVRAFVGDLLCAFAFFALGIHVRGCVGARV